MSHLPTPSLSRGGLGWGWGYPQATDAYLFNAPGVGGPLGNLADALTSTFGLNRTPSGNIWNIRGPEGFPAIPGLGYQLGTAISIQTEATANPLNNHSIVGLTDAGNDEGWEVAA